MIKSIEIIIPGEKSSCIRDDLKIDLGKYTVLAGVNNSGKTSIVRALINHKDLTDYEKIHIPAENVKPKEEVLKNTATGDSFYKIIQDILNPIFDKNILDNLIEEFDKSSDKTDFIEGVNTILRQFGVDKKEFDIKISQDEFKESVIVKIAKGIVRDLYKTDIEEVDINNIGMGTQRLIIAALIQYYEMNKISDGKKTLLIIEEPEIYLHPKWKSSLHNALVKLSEDENIKVLITTHDPYFIELGKDQKIWKVYRDSEKNDTTAIEIVANNTLLASGFKSHSEINYSIFDIPSNAYFLELYEHSKRKVNSDYRYPYKDFDNKMFNDHFRAKGRTQSIDGDKRDTLMDITKLRHCIAHGKEDDTISISLEDAIKDIIDYLKSI